VFNSLIKSYGQALLMEATFKVFHWMHDFCKPDIASYNVLLSALVQNHRHETAIAFFNQLGCAGIPLIVSTFNITINALCYVKRVEEAIGLSRQIPEHKWPSTSAFIIHL
jgi:pentatricopeptide repeat protein